jgi:hypothetical protein
VSGLTTVVLRVSYARLGELRDDVAQQMARGGLLVKVHDLSDLALDTPVQLELVLPDGTSLHGATQVLQVFTGFGVAVSVSPALVDQARRAATGVDTGGTSPARHERIAVAPHATQPPRPRIGATGTPAPFRRLTPTGVPALDSAPRAAAPPAPAAGPSRNDKIQQALHGTRDERNAILRDRDRTLHPFVLKNPQLHADDVVAIAKNAQMAPELLKQIAERKDWFQRPAIALALARNPKTPPELAVRALDHIPLDAVRQMAKGVGVLPHVTQAARKKLLG